MAGRLVFRKYIKNEHPKYGIKVYMLTEPSCLILKTLVYSGMQYAKGHIQQIVLHLLKEYFGYGHAVFMDHFYNSYELAWELLNQKTYCTGTLNEKRRHNPKDVVTEKLKKGETVSKYSDGVMIAKWRDKRVYLFIPVHTIRKQNGQM